MFSIYSIQLSLVSSIAIRETRNATYPEHTSVFIKIASITHRDGVTEAGLVD